MFYIIYFLLLSPFIAFLFIQKYNKKIHNNFNLDKIIKVLTIILLIISIIDIFLPDAFSLRFIWDFNYLKEHHDPFHAIIRLFNSMAVIALPIGVFYKKDSFIKIISYILIPTILINTICYFKYIEYYTSPLTKEYATVFGDTLYPFLTNKIFRSIIFSLIMGLESIISLYLLINNLDKLKFNSRKEVVTFIFLFIALLISNMPIYTFQQLFGTTSNVTFNVGDPMHFIFIIIIILECITLSLIFKNQSYENKYILLLIMAISLMFQYNSFFKTDGVITATRYPLQLCNIAGAFLITTLLLKSEKMFHFTVVVNVTGALIAIALCDSTKDVGILYEMNIHYMVEHINVLLTPLLALILGVFKPLKIKDLKHFIIGFSIYYLFILLLGTIFNGIALKTNNTYFDCNYLFMFKKEAAVRLVGAFVGKLFDIKITLFKYFNLYLAQLLVYLVFLSICTLIFFILYLIFKNKSKRQYE